MQIFPERGKSAFIVRFKRQYVLYFRRERVPQNSSRMKIAPLGLAGGRSYDRTNSLRTPTMKESQLLREKTTSSVFLSTCSNAVHAQFH